MKVAILHLSDIHIRSKDDQILGRHQKIASTLFAILPEVGAVICVVTGDIVFSGAEQEYAVAETFFKSLIEDIRGELSSDIPVHFVCVPGNHDGTFKASSMARDILIERVREAGEAAIEDSVVSLCTEPQAAYFAFEKRMASAEVVIDDPLWKQYRICIGEKRIGISAINAAWMSKVPEEPGKLVFPVKKYAALARYYCDVRIGLMHHPLNWYAQDTYHPLRELCRAQFQILMSGHEHTDNLSVIQDGVHGTSVLLEAGALVPEKNLTSAFSVVTLDLETERFAKVDFVWDDTKYCPKDGEAVWDSFVSLPARKNDGFSLAEDFKARLEDPGAAFTHPNKEKLELSDIYVFPDIQESDDIDGVPETVNSEILAKQLNKLGHVLLSGDDQYGKSALLYSLYRRYFVAGYVPVLLSGRELAGSTAEQMQRKLLSAIRTQYGDDAPNDFAQLSRSSKILLLDDLDKTGPHNDQVSRVLEFALKHFDYSVVTVGDHFDLAELTSSRTVAFTSKFKRYKLLGFGYKLRAELIQRWYSVGISFIPDTLERQTHDAETIVNTIIGRGLVPTTAFNVLVLLQSLEVKERNLVNAGMAEYYEFLIRRSFIQAKLKTDEFDEVFSYLSALAWKLYEKGEKSIEEDELKRFNDEFSNNIHYTDFATRVDLLIRCRVLMKVGTSFSFRYSYIRYFFAAKHIADHFEEDEKMKDVARAACRHLYLRENANIILFLTHHTASRWVIREVVQILSQLLSHLQPLNIQSDASILNGWVTKTARMVIDASDVSANRREQREREDETAKLEEIEEPEQEVSDLDQLDLIAQLNLVFKASEILGQILKNRYGSLDKRFKNDLMRELFEGPLRGVSFFLSLLNSAPEAFVSEISAKLCERIPNLDQQRADNAAQKLLFLSLGLFAEAMFARQGEIIGSPKLNESIDNLVKNSSNPSYKMVAISAQLSYPGQTPVGTIESFAKELRHNVFGFRILQNLVGRHLYMFSLPHAERHRLAKAVDIDVRIRRSIEVNSSDVKLLPGPGRRPSNSKSLLSRLNQAFLVTNKGTQERLKVLNMKKKDIRPTKTEDSA